MSARRSEEIKEKADMVAVCLFAQTTHIVGSNSVFAWELALNFEFVKIGWGVWDPVWIWESLFASANRW